MKKSINYSKRLFFILFISYVIIAMIPFLLILANWSQVTDIVTNQAEEASTSIVRQIRSQVDNRLHAITQVQSQIYSNQLTQTLMYSSVGFTGENILRAHDLIQEIQSYEIISNCSDMLWLYLNRLDIVLTGSTTATPQMLYTVYVDQDMPYEDFLACLQEEHTRNGLSTLLGSDKTRYAAFWCSLPKAQNGNPLGNIGVLVKESDFVGMLDTAHEVNDGMAYIFDTTGRLLFCSSKAEPLAEQIDPSHLSNMQQLEIGGKTYIAAKEISDGSSLVYLTLLPIENVLAPVLRMQRKMVLLVSITTVLMMAGALFVTWRNYRPLNTIIEQVDTIGSDIQSPHQGVLAYMESGVKHVVDQRQKLQELAQRSQQVMRSSFLTHLLNNVYDHDQQSFQQDCRQYGISMEKPLYCVLAIHVDSYDKYADPESGDKRGDVWLVMSDLIECLPDVQNIAAVANYERNTLCLILNFDYDEQPELQENIQSSAQWIKTVIEHEYSAVATVGIGSLEEGYALIHQSYLNALHALEYRVVQGVSSIINCKDISMASHHGQAYFDYSAETEARLEKHVRSGSYEETEAVLDAIFHENFVVHPIPVSLVRCLLFDMTSTVVRLINALNIQTELVPPDQDLIEYLSGGMTIELAQKRFKEIYWKLCEDVSSKKRSHNDELRVAVEEYIVEHYADENLSQQMIADQFGKSANYLSYFFREQTGEKMSSYISGIRISKARELLSETEMSVKDIAASTGFGSDLNFIRVFKKLVGETPGQYRKRMQGT